MGRSDYGGGMIVTGVAFMQVQLANGTIIYANVAIDTATIRAKTKRMHFGSPHLYKFLDGIRLAVTGADAFTNAVFNIYVSDGPDPSIHPETLSYTLPLSDLEDFNAVHPEDSKYYAFEIIDAQVRTDWKLSEIDIYGGAIGESF